MSFLLDHAPQQSSPPFDGDVVALQAGLAGALAKIEEQMRAMSSDRLLIIVTGHPGTGKSTLVRALEALSLPAQMATLHVDDYLDWGKLAAYVERECGGDAAAYLPLANQIALGIVKEKMSASRIVVLEGGGLIEDYAAICDRMGFRRPLFVVADADPSVFSARLAARGDAMHISGKETAERRKNLDDLSRHGGIRICTSSMNKMKPEAELKALLSGISDALAQRLPLDKTDTSSRAS